MNYHEVSNAVIDIAQDLIQKYHPALKEARIGFVFQDKAGTSGGKLVYAKTSKVPPAYQVHLELDFLIKISFDLWCDLISDQHTALIDHELCHCVYEQGLTSWCAHDIEEFTDILDRYGLWNHNLLSAGKVLNKASQLSFVLEDAQALQRMGAVIAVDPAQVPVEK